MTWDPEKDARLRADDALGRVGLADCVVAVEEGRVLDDLPHPVRDGQRLLVVAIEGYAYVVPT